jgi:hypothetical protein
MCYNDSGRLPGSRFDYLQTPLPYDSPVSEDDQEHEPQLIRNRQEKPYSKTGRNSGAPQPYFSKPTHRSPQFIIPVAKRLTQLAGKSTPTPTNFLTGSLSTNCSN